FVVNLPLGNNVFARDWVASGVYAARSGRPFTVNQSTNDVGTNMFGLPNMTGTPSYPGTVDKWFDTSIFTPVTKGAFANEAPNQRGGPGFKSSDRMVKRTIHLSGRYTFTRRRDSFNLFNKTNFGLPAHNISGGDVATITSLSGDARITQLAIRFGF